MATEKDYQSLYDRIAALREQVAGRLSADLISNPQLADALTKQIDDMLASVVDADCKIPPPPDKGLAHWSAFGPEAARELGVTRIPPGVEALRRNHHLGTHHRRRRHVLSLAAREDRRFPRGAEAAGAVQGRHGAALGRPGRVCAVPVRSPRSAALYQDAIASRLTSESSDTAVRRFRPARAPTPTSTNFSLISFTR